MIHNECYRHAMLILTALLPCNISCDAMMHAIFVLNCFVGMLPK
jgi:hypothetical protein